MIMPINLVNQKLNDHHDVLLMAKNDPLKNNHASSLLTIPPPGAQINVSQAKKEMGFYEKRHPHEDYPQELKETTSKKQNTDFRSAGGQGALAMKQSEQKFITNLQSESGNKNHHQFSINQQTH